VRFSADPPLEELQEAITARTGERPHQPMSSPPPSIAGIESTMLTAIRSYEPRVEHQCTSGGNIQLQSFVQCIRARDAKVNQTLIPLDSKQPPPG
jgi:hypothetical protein